MLKKFRARARNFSGMLTKKSRVHDNHQTVNRISLDNHGGISIYYEEINRKLMKARQSFPPSISTESQFEGCERLSDASIQIMLDEIMLDEIMLDGTEILSGGNILVNLEPLTDGSIVNAKSGFYDGATLENSEHDTHEELANKENLPIVLNPSLNPSLEVKSDDRAIAFNTIVKEQGGSSNSTPGSVNLEQRDISSLEYCETGQQRIHQIQGGALRNEYSGNLNHNGNDNTSPSTPRAILDNLRNNPPYS